MTLEIFLLGLMIVSIFTGLFTEGIKKLLDEMRVKYHSNFLAGGSAVRPSRRRVPDSDGDADQRQDGGIFNCTCAAVLACFYGWVR